MEETGLPEPVPLQGSGAGEGEAEESDDIKRLQERINALKESDAPEAGVGRELGLVFSLGFVVVTTLAMGAFGGHWLAQRFAWPGLEPAVLGVSVFMAAVSVYALLRPFLGK